MQRLLLSLTFIFFLLSHPVYSQTANHKLDITNENSVGYSIEYWYGYSGHAGVFYSWTPDETRVSFHSQNTMSITEKGFSEFDLTPWLLLNLPSSSITKIEFTLTSHDINPMSSPATISLYEMLDLEDGAITAYPQLQYEVTKSKIGDFLWDGTAYGPVSPYFAPDETLSMDVSASVLTDIDNAQGFTGFILESDRIYGMAATNNPVLSIYYDAPSVPEPLTMALFAFGTLLLKFIHRKR